MYIPTQEERYSKVARFTLLLCVLLPSAVVMWLAEIADILTCTYAFLLPVAMPLDWVGFNKVAALCISALVQGIVFFWLAATKALCQVQNDHCRYLGHEFCPHPAGTDCLCRVPGSPRAVMT